MDSDYVKLGHELDRGIRELGNRVPGTMGAFRELISAASSDGALNTKTKELMALAIGIAVRCDGSITLHTRSALKAGATGAEISETIGVAIEMGGGPAMVYGVAALVAYDQFLQDELSSEKVG